MAGSELRLAGWYRLGLAHLLQVPALALIALLAHPTAWWPAALWSSVICCLATDSGWRWRNRLLVAEASAWLTLAMLFGWPAQN